MTIVSLVFYLFVAVSVLFYFLTPKKYRWLVLLIASLIFYWINGKLLVLVLIGVSLVTWLIGLWIQRINDRNVAFLKGQGKELSQEERRKRKETTKRNARLVLALGILLDLVVLLFLKYYNFFGRNLNMLLQKVGAEGESIPYLNLLLPLGISFYTLQAISYMTDVYRTKINADRNPVKFLLFMSFFPQIIQGPIPRYGQLAQQLYEGHNFDYKRLCHGAQLMLWGILKKLVIAERLAVPVATVFGNYTEYSGPINFFAAALYGLQVYTDFSGGMDIARGVAQMVGVELELNFIQPYNATSIEDFWRRWHITMGRWMRDYLFYPLSISKAFASMSRKCRKILGQFVGKRLPSLLAMFLVYLAVGFWHGSSWKYVAYGLWNGMIIMSGILLENVYRVCREKCGIQEESVGWQTFRRLRTFMIVSFGRFFTAASSLTAALTLMRNTFRIKNLTFLTNSSLIALGLKTSDWIVLIFAVLMLFVVDQVHERKIAIRDSIDKQLLVFRWTIYIAAVVIVLILGYYGPTYNAASFIYEQF